MWWLAIGTPFTMVPWGPAASSCPVSAEKVRTSLMVTAPPEKPSFPAPALETTDRPHHSSPMQDTSPRPCGPFLHTQCTWPYTTLLRTCTHSTQHTPDMLPHSPRRSKSCYLSLEDRQGSPPTLQVPKGSQQDKPSSSPSLESTHWMGTYQNNIFTLKQMQKYYREECKIHMNFED